MNWKVISLAVLFVGAFLFGCESDDEESHTHSHTHEQDVPKEYADRVNPFDGNAAAVAAGEQLFKTHCASCHGNTGKGNGPKAPATIPDWTIETDILTASDGMLYWHVAEGLTGTAMPAWKTTLSQDEIWQVIAYIRTL
ncbi:MAG: c-type cytochrome [Myxococcales bacterium]|nr:c-type cytochrome [Myxococcales bacterium]